MYNQRYIFIGLSKSSNFKFLSSPVQNPFFNHITIDKSAPLAVYLQISKAIIELIRQGILKPGFKLPGTRTLAAMLLVHRKTVIAALEELHLQGWLEVYPYKGTFISKELPESKPQSFTKKSRNVYLEKAGFSLYPKSFLTIPQTITHKLEFNDGFPDARLAPLNELSSAYSRILKIQGAKNNLSYGDIRGDEFLRSTLAKSLNNFRGLNVNADNVMITRGSAMAIYLVTQTLISAGDHVVVGETNYLSANLCFKKAGAQLNYVPVDEDGLVVDAIEKICINKKIRAIYVTSHHHHPTTVTLSPERRMNLLQLAEKYRFAIIEDDYDYDFHYLNRPVLPLASADKEGLVIYIGSFSKKMAPAFRVGYLIAPQDFIMELMRIRRIVDRQGDPVLEKAVGILLEEGTIQRYTRKALAVYRERRNFTCALLKEKLGDDISFKIPDGGMAIWAEYNQRIDLQKISRKCLEKGLYLSDGKMNNPEGKNLNSCRMGFATMNNEEIMEAVGILERVVKNENSFKR